MENKKNGLVITLIVIISILCLVIGWLLGSKFSDIEKEGLGDSNTNIEDNNSIDNEKNDTELENNENQLTLSNMVGLFKGNINGTDASGGTMTAYFQLNIMENSTCEFSRGVSGGSGWTASGNCILEDSKIVLTSNELQFDADQSSESKKYTFIINSVDSISYSDGLGNVILIKQ